MEHRLFHSEPDEREPYTIVIPPPNVTGMLHMGHMLNNTLQDVLVRRARMQGKNACWVPGTDHASIATEAKVVANAQGRRASRSRRSRARSSSRHAWEWKEKYGGVILQAAAQAGRLVRLGAHLLHDGRSPHRERPARSSATSTKRARSTAAYAWSTGIPRRRRRCRTKRWSSRSRTASSTTCATRSKARTRTIIVATTRPETILGDTALCVNPDDPRYGWLPAGRPRHRAAGGPLDARDPRRHTWTSRSARAP